MVFVRMKNCCFPVKILLVTVGEQFSVRLRVPLVDWGEVVSAS